MAKAELLWHVDKELQGFIWTLLQGLWGESSRALCHEVAASMQNPLELVGGITGREREGSR